jgi:2-polyprenyl-3-methyl-5-hydroxy-6-metoxy-1,4-benzoquinol methylase
LKYPREADLIGHYDSHPEYYSPAGSPTFVAMLLEFAGAQPRSVLDVGCGDGRLGRILQRNHDVLYVDGIDASPVRIALARRANPGGAYMLGDIYQVLRDLHASYDLVFMVEVLEHLEAPKEALGLALTHGSVVATVPKNMKYIAHLQLYRDEQDVIDQLAPNRIREEKQHFALWWAA